jgi:hypothetical protein
MTQQPPQIGATVRRIEPPTNGLATVIAVDAAASEDISVCVAYAEGGEGWWPLDCLSLEP